MMRRWCAALAVSFLAAPAWGQEDYSRLLRARLWQPAGSETSSADLSGDLRPAGRQGDYRGTCSVFAAAGLGEFLIRTVRGEDFKISESHLYYSAKRDFTGAPELQVYKTIDGLAGFVAVEALQGPLLAQEYWPYQERLDQARDSGSGLQAAFAPEGPLLSGAVPLRIAGRDDSERFTGAPPAGMEERLRRDLRFKPVAVERGAIKQYLSQERKPVVFNIMVYFRGVDRRSGRLRDPTDQERRLCRDSGQGCGGHTILLTGYDSSSREFTFRNSWGPDWGAKGYGRLSERYILEDCEMCSYLQGLPSLSEGDRKMVVNGAHGWSADL